MNQTAGRGLWFLLFRRIPQRDSNSRCKPLFSLSKTAPADSTASRESHEIVTLQRGVIDFESMPCV
jgi:hypothetical protein